MQPTVTMVSAGLLVPKKGDSLAARAQLYLNYGLLGLTTILHRRGFNARMFHGEFRAPELLVRVLAREGAITPPAVVCLSLPSFFSVPWARRFALELKAKHPEVRLILGGRWVIGNDDSWIRRMIPWADLAVAGTAERRIVDIVSASEHHVSYAANAVRQEAPASCDEFPDHDFGLNYEYLKYQPTVECSRGCGLGCAFCVERETPMTRMRAPTKVADALQAAHRAYRGGTITPYFQASMFLPSECWAVAFRGLCRSRGLSVNWRCETRVDLMSMHALAALAEAGLKVVDVGLESASPAQLRAMRKTRDPRAYLTRASEFLRVAHSCGIWSKVNILLYAGETLSTLEDTCDWLDRHRPYIKGISAYPVMVYGCGPEARLMLAKLRALGADAVDEATIDADGYCNVHLSQEVDHALACAKARDISQRFMSARDYFDLKAFSYFPRGFTYAEFCRLCEGTPAALLPFGHLDQASDARTARKPLCPALVGQASR